MKDVNKLTTKDYIAFVYSYFHTKDDREIIVSQISQVTDDGRFLVFFLWGHHSCSEFIKKEEVVAIGNMEGDAGIKGWTGKFDLIKPDNEVLKENLK